MDLKIGIMGVGMVGTPLKDWFLDQGYKRSKNLFLYDINPRLEFDDKLTKADIIFVCLPTPPYKDGSCNTSHVFNAVKNIQGHKMIVIKSTVPPGTTERLQEDNYNHDLYFNPEFLTERQAAIDFVRPDRQIVGFTEKSLESAHQVLKLLPRAPFMSPWGVGTYKQIRITATEAEFIKYAGNVFFALKVNFANVISQTAQIMGSDISYENIRAALGADHRIGDSHMNVDHGGYRGFGGFCLPKDLAAFTYFVNTLGLENAHRLLQANFDFNAQELNVQGLSVKDVSIHDKALEEKLKKLRNRR